MLDVMIEMLHLMLSQVISLYIAFLFTNAEKRMREIDGSAKSASGVLLYAGFGTPLYLFQCYHILSIYSMILQKVRRVAAHFLERETCI
jgi:hypothetical protein